MSPLQEAIRRATLKQYAGPVPKRLKDLKSVYRKAVNNRWEAFAESELKGANFYVINSWAEKGHLPDERVVVRQFHFSTKRGWVADFALPHHRILIEIDGGIWMQGGSHALPTNIIRDIEKQNEAVQLGWRPLRFTPDHLKSGDMIRLVIAMTNPR